MQATAATATRTPATFWIVAAVGLLWNAFGAYDFIMTNIRDPAYLAHLPADMMDWIDEFPLWALAVWAIGVWGAIVGSVLLLLRSRFAVHAFAVSLAGLALSTLYQATSAMPASMRTPAMIGMTALIWLMALALLWYAVPMRRAGVLR